MPKTPKPTPDAKAEPVKDATPTQVEPPLVKRVTVGRSQFGFVQTDNKQQK